MDWAHRADSAIGHLSCWFHLQLRGHNGHKSVLPMTDCSSLVKETLGCCFQRITVRTEEQSQAWKLTSQEENGIPWNIIFGCKAVRVIFKTGESWSLSCLSKGCLAEPKWCKYPCCKGELGSPRHRQCSISVIFIMRMRERNNVDLFLWMLVLYNNSCSLWALLSCGALTAIKHSLCALPTELPLS